jgi:hypothetical protein
MFFFGFGFISSSTLYRVLVCWRQKQDVAPPPPPPSSPSPVSNVKITRPSSSLVPLPIERNVHRVIQCRERGLGI